MLLSSGPVPKLYLSVIDDVVESMRELLMEEGVEAGVLDDLRELWESKLLQTKALENFRKDDNNFSNFVMQLPANYCGTDQGARSGIPPRQKTHCLPNQNSPESLTTYTLPAGLTYPVQIPAGVTLQTASGQLYKVNVPVVVAQASAGYQPPVYPTQKAEPSKLLPENWNSFHWQPNVSLSASPRPQVSYSAQPEDALEERNASPQPIDLSTASSSNKLMDLHVKAPLMPVPESKDSKVADILTKVIGGKDSEAVIVRSLTPAKTDEHPEGFVKLNLNHGCNMLSDIIQLDGPVDDLERVEGVPPEKDDFLAMINAEAVLALQEAEGSSDNIGTSDSSDSDGSDEYVGVEDEDPLNSGDDVVEQDIPDLFDTDNLVLCLYEKIQRSKNRWRFLLKDGVMYFGGRDHVFSKAVGEAEW